MKMPFIKFYVRDWMGDPQLRMCSIAARGLWFEMICLMHGAKRCGFLETQAGKPLTDDETSRLTGTFKGDLYTLKQELLDHGVPSVEENTGIWYCRRMVKEEQKRNKCSLAGKAGGGNPALHHDTSSEDTDTRNQKPDTRNHISIKETFKGDLYRSSSTDDGFERFWSSYPRKIGKQAAKNAWRKAKGKPKVDIIIEVVNQQKQTEQWQKDNGQFIPHPATWINQGRWDDALTTEIEKPRYFAEG